MITGGALWGPARRRHAVKCADCACALLALGSAALRPHSQRASADGHDGHLAVAIGEGQTV